MRTNLIKFSVNRREENFDKACAEAYHSAIARFGINESGHSDKAEDFNRSTDSIMVKFDTLLISGNMNGINHEYKFTACIERFGDTEAQETNGDTTSEIYSKVKALSKNIMDGATEDLVNHNMDVDCKFGFSVKILVSNIVKGIYLEMKKNNGN